MLGLLSGYARVSTESKISPPSAPVWANPPLVPAACRCNDRASAAPSPSDRDVDQPGADAVAIIYRPRHGAPGLLPSQMDRKAKQSRSAGTPAAGH